MIGNKQGFNFLSADRVQSVGGSGLSDVYFGGNDSLILRFDGSQLTKEPTDIPDPV